jgi:hypothetical protein
MIECILIKDTGMTGYPTKGRWALLKLLLSQRVIFIKAVCCRLNLRCLPKHGGDGPFLGSLVAKKLAPLGDQLLLLVLAHVQGPKLGHYHGVFRLGIHQTRPLRDDLVFLAPDSVEGFHRRADEGFSGANDGLRKLHPSTLGHAGVVSLSVLGQGGEGIERIAATAVPKGEALCLGERPDFHARSQRLVNCSRKKCGIVLGGRPLSLLGIFQKGLRRCLALAEGGIHLLLHILEEGVLAHGGEPLLGVGYVLLLRSLGNLGDSRLATAASDRSS